MCLHLYAPVQVFHAYMRMYAYVLFSHIYVCICIGAYKCLGIFIYFRMHLTCNLFIYKRPNSLHYHIYPKSNILKIENVFMYL